MAVSIMHISDLHLGEDLVFRSVRRWRRWWKSVDPGITNGLARAIRDLRPDFVVVSGDIVNKPHASCYRFAAEYLRKLFQAADFDYQTRLLVIPGNHDASFFPKSNPRDVERLGPYLSFLRDLFQESDDFARRHRYLKVDPQRRVAFFCLDSTLKDDLPLAEGQIGPNQREWLRAKVNRLASMLGSNLNEYIKVAVLHHHCVPVAGRSGRFMQLLDEAELVALLDELGFHLALHGHRHVPHSVSRMRADSSLLTVVGAGTATCPFLEEQEGYGNNFNWLTVEPSLNQLHVQVYAASLASGEFATVGARKTFPLFRVPSQGYSAKMIRKVVSLGNDGTIYGNMLREDLTVNTEGTKAYRFPVRLSTDESGAKIENFTREPLTTPTAQLQLNVHQDTLVDGDWIIDPPMVLGSPPVTINYSYVIKGCAAMSKPEFEKSRRPGPPEEWTAIVVNYTAQSLKIEVQFPTVPRRFETTTRVRVKQLGGEVQASAGYRLSHDKLSNRCVLEVTDPPLNHEIAVVWSLPDNWERDRAESDPPKAAVASA
jgi:3',5'-cyclic AMP phosphodiesterase CpdA